MRTLAVLNRTYALAIVSSGSRSRLKNELRSLHLNGFFATVICGDDTEEKKPSPEPLYLALRKLNVNSKNAIFVGDTYEDILMGKIAGCITVLIKSGYTDMSKVGYTEPEINIRKIDDLLLIL